MEEISNRAEFQKGDSIPEMMRKHDENVKRTIARAEKGEIINLSDLLIDKEKIDEKIIRERGEYVE